MTADASIRLATRGSALALAQANITAAALRGITGGACEMIVVTSRGDARGATPIVEMEGQGWFTGELERSLLAGHSDVAVHSAKDLPTEATDGLEVVALLERGDPRDAAVTRDGCALKELAPGASVGTSSPRRQALLGALFPHLTTVPMRGNVDSRLRRLDAGEVDAVVLACAGLDRLDMGGRIAERLDPRRFVPAPAQGAIAVQAVTGSAAGGTARRLDHAPTAMAVAAERAVLRRLGGGCLLPLGVWGRVEDGRLVVAAALGRGDGDVASAEVAGDVSDPAALADAVAEQLR